ncbi:MAG: undecaprenyl-phosphate glucose phosphotransferase [Thermodesulfobacteriota bacterium]|nr:MAG: undecaprenyl-phosphate glucose phosphotransferase [Thermodesulfobacteriota bacterium]
MLKKHSQLFENLLFITDIIIILSSWVFSYYVRFNSGLFPVDKGVPPIHGYLLLLIPIMIIWAVAFKGFSLYRPKRIGSHAAEVFTIAKASVASVIILITFSFFLRQYEFSRLVFLLFTFFNIVVLSFERIVFREILRFIRKKGYNLRYALIAGTGESARILLTKLEKHPEVGIKVVGIVSGDEEDLGSRIKGVRVIGLYEDINGIISRESIDKVFMALPWDEHSKVVDILRFIGDETVDIMVIPDVYEFVTLRGGVEEFDGIPIMNLRHSPLYGWNLIVKRTADIMLSGFFILTLAPLMAIIAILIKLSSPGPVFYRQERMGIDGVIFHMLKFRSMRTDAERETGAVWSRKDDPRRTRIGAFLRKTSLDEIPQFFNVLKGDMSLVGPRPERPVFITEFRKKIPKYMLRHKVKAGVTGWAQVNGWRGNTDINKRIEHDLYYIENWSFFFDLKIVCLTIWKGLINKNAY